MTSIIHQTQGSQVNQQTHPTQASHVNQQTQPTQQTQATQQRAKNLGVRRASTSGVTPRPSTRLSTTMNVVGPATRRTTLTKITTPDKKTN